MRRLYGLRGRRSKGRGKGIRARGHARRRREEGRARVWGSFPFSLARPNSPFPSPFYRLPRRLGTVLSPVLVLVVVVVFQPFTKRPRDEGRKTIVSVPRLGVALK